MIVKTGCSNNIIFDTYKVCNLKKFKILCQVKKVTSLKKFNN